jgi:hypothetical protein
MDPTAARSVLEAAWRAPGFCVPHAGTYPFQWLWDSCFHAVVWAALGDRRAVDELRSALAHQSPAGFVPHITYWADPDHHASFWGRPLTSGLTQPPMYGHAVACCIRRGLPVGGDLVARAEAGLRFLLERRERTPGGLVAVVHPWETGCDDSLRWDDWLPDDPTGRYDRKGELVAAVSRLDGDPVGSDTFAVGSVGFNALVVWNVRQLAEVGAAQDLVAPADEVAAAVARRWDPVRRTWTDTDTGSGATRTLDALLGLLVDPRPEAITDLVDPAAHGAPYGPCGAHRDEPGYRPDRYWRGTAWPQLTYLLTLAVSAAGRDGEAGELARALIDGAERSGAAEHWNPDTGEGYGARPQSWTTLAAVVADRAG